MGNRQWHAFAQNVADPEQDHARGSNRIVVVRLTQIQGNSVAE
ncbi:hypothetical protein BH160DRAFT_3295 [Burkholderia sp. H160]|nr:hypothetical protein BH160DRAFT_3295 [Burkholderia sp. H160]